MNRMSSLPVAEFCGAAHKVPNAGGRAAAMSTAFHAHCANAEDADAKLHRLTPDEQAEILTWHAPIAAELNNGTKLQYVDADLELEVGLDAEGRCVPAEHPSCISVGHLDMAWEHEGVAYIGDIKKSEFTSEVDSLQMAAYGFAYAHKHGCHSMAAGIWAATEGAWAWGPIVDFDSDAALTLWMRVKHAILNVSEEFSRGPHCRKCYGRWHCPAWLLPPEVAESTLKALTGGEPTQGQALELLLTIQRAEDTIDEAKKQLQDFARKQGIRDGKGKVYLPVVSRGRETLDKEALAKVVNLKDFTKRGADFDTFRWVKEK